MKHLMILAVTVVLLAALTAPAFAQWDTCDLCVPYEPATNYAAGNSTFSNPGSYVQPYTAPSPPSYQAPSFTVPDYGSAGATYCCDFSAQEEAQARREESNWQLQNLYQNQRPVACGPAMSPRARDGC